MTSSSPPQQQQQRANTSGTSFPSELRDLLQSRLGDLEKQLLSKVNNLEEEKSLLFNETTAHRQKTESTLNSLLTRINELEKGKSLEKERCMTDTYRHTRVRTNICLCTQSDDSSTHLQHKKGDSHIVNTMSHSFNLLSTIPLTDPITATHILYPTAVNN